MLSIFCSRKKGRCEKTWGRLKIKKKMSCFMKQYALHCGAQFSYRSWQRFKELIDKSTECLSGKGCLGQGHPLQLQKPWRREAILWALLCILLDFTAFPKLTEQFVAIGNRIVQKKVIDPMRCAHGLNFNEVNLLCFTVTTFSCSKQVPQVVSSSLPLYVSFAQWTFWSTFGWENHPVWLSEFK